MGAKLSTLEITVIAALIYKNSRFRF